WNRSRGREQPPRQCAPQSRTRDQRSESRAAAGARHRGRQKNQYRGGQGRDVSVGGVRIKNKVQDAEQRGDHDSPGQQLCRPTARPASRIQHPQDRRQRKEAPGSEGGHQPRPHASWYVLHSRGEQQLINSKVPPPQELQEREQPYGAGHRRGGSFGQLPPPSRSSRLLSQRPQ